MSPMDLPKRRVNWWFVAESAVWFVAGLAIGEAIGKWVWGR